MMADPSFIRLPLDRSGVDLLFLDRADSFRESLPANGFPVVGLFEIPTALSHLTSGSAFASGRILLELGPCGSYRLNSCWRSA